MRGAFAGLAVLLVLASVVCFVGLGEHGFRSTEGHRVVPGWELLESGEVFPTRMFERVYVRKPPGMPWAVAASGALFGESEFSARLPSALSGVGMVVAAWWFCGMWFGWRAGFFAGVAQLCMPTLWFTWRAAEIEALMLVSAQVAALSCAHVLVFGARGWKVVLWGLVIGLGLLVTVLAKGPAAVPVVGAVVVVGLVVRRRMGMGAAGGWRAIGVGVGVSGLVLGVLGWIGARMLRAAREAGAAVEAQGVGDFVLRADVGELAVFPLVLFVAALPVSLGLLFPWGADARAEAEAVGEEGLRRYALGRVLAFGWLAAVGLYVVMLLGNPRYGLPAQVLLAPVAGYVFWLLGGGVMTGSRRVVARVMLLGVGLGRWGWVSAWPVVFAGVFVWWVTVFEAGRGEESGRLAGERLGTAIAGGSEEGGVVEVWSSFVINARPEVLLYAERAAREEGVELDVRWARDALAAGEVPGVGGVVVLRGEPGEAELVERFGAGAALRLERVHSDAFYRFAFSAYRVRGGEGGGG